MLQNILNIFYYLFDTYGLTNGIYVNVSNAIQSIQYMWSVENSNLTFKFTSISQFQDAYNNMNNIEYIIYKTDFISLKYYPKIKRAILTTEQYQDITNLSNLMRNLGLKETLYSLKTPNALVTDSLHTQ